MIPWMVAFFFMARCKMKKVKLLDSGEFVKSYPFDPAKSEGDKNVFREFLNFSP
jgi:hypothetical protein